MSNQGNNNDEFEKIKLMYDNVYDELNRSRDWPIKIMAFATAGDLAVFGLIKFTDTSSLGCWKQVLLTVLILGLAFFTILNVLNQDNEYKKYRATQKNMQRWLEIQTYKLDAIGIFPDHYIGGNEIPKKRWIYRKLAGWPFYVAYIVALGILALILIWH